MTRTSENELREYKKDLIATYPDKWHPKLKKMVQESANRAKMSISQYVRIALLAQIEKDKEN